jgi:hypothetical protein
MPSLIVAIVTKNGATFDGRLLCRFGNNVHCGNLQRGDLQHDYLQRENLRMARRSGSVALQYRTFAGGCSRN